MLKTLSISGVLLIVLGVDPTLAGMITRPIAYDMRNGQGQEVGDASFNYFDHTYDGQGDPGVAGSPLSGGLGQLTDGILGSDDYAADLGNGNAHEWVAWLFIEPVITFEFQHTIHFDTISFHANNIQRGGVFLFASVNLAFSDDGVVFGDSILYHDHDCRASRHVRKVHRHQCGSNGSFRQGKFYT